jgi:hypothetical protein
MRMQKKRGKRKERPSARLIFSWESRESSALNFAQLSFTTSPPWVLGNSLPVKSKTADEFQKGYRKES